MVKKYPLLLVFNLLILRSSELLSYSKKVAHLHANVSEVFGNPLVNLLQGTEGIGNLLGNSSILANFLIGSQCPPIMCKRYFRYLVDQFSGGSRKISSDIFKLPY